MANFLLIIVASGVMGIMISVFYNLTHSRAVYASKMTGALTMYALLSAMMLYLKFSVGGVAVIGVAIIIRFRMPIKDHRDMAYILWAVISGFCCATHMYGILGLASALMIVVMMIFNAVQKSDRVIMVVRGAGDKEDEIIEKVMELSGDKLVMRENNCVEDVITELIYEIKRYEKPFQVAQELKERMYRIAEISEVHIMYQDDDMAI